MFSVVDLLERAGIIEEDRLRETVALSWPRIVTGFAIMSKRAVDLAIVGLAIGSTAVAGVTVASAFWTVGKLVLIGVAGGTLALVSQSYGGDDRRRVADVAGTSVVASLLIALPVVALFSLRPGELVSLIAGSTAATGSGATYLLAVAPGLLFEGLNLVASRTYAGTGDTVTPMVVRTAGAVLNVAMSVGFVFGAGLGVFGAGLGTTLSTAMVALVFVWGLSGRSYGGWGASPVPVVVRLPDSALVRQLLSVSSPLVARRLAQGLVIFPLLAVAATFGPAAIAAIGVARRVRELLNSFTWGFSIAASTLVGQSLGASDVTQATDYGREIAKLSLAVYLLVAVVVAALANPIADVFVDGDAIPLTELFVIVAAVSSVALGVDGTVTGALRGAGDTRTPFLATLAGLYLVALPFAYLGSTTALGLAGLLLALIAETGVPMVVNVLRFRTGAWVDVSRAYRPSANDD